MKQIKVRRYVALWGEYDMEPLFKYVNDFSVNQMISLVSNIKSNPDITTAEIAEYNKLPQEDLDNLLGLMIECGMVREVVA